MPISILQGLHAMRGLCILYEQKCWRKHGAQIFGFLNLPLFTRVLLILIVNNYNSIKFIE